MLHHAAPDERIIIPSTVNNSGKRSLSPTNCLCIKDQQMMNCWTYYNRFSKIQMSLLSKDIAQYFEHVAHSFFILQSASSCKMH